jgi:hypothetical protein
MADGLLDSIASCTVLQVSISQHHLAARLYSCLAWISVHYSPHLDPPTQQLVRSYPRRGVLHRAVYLLKLQVRDRHQPDPSMAHLVGTWTVRLLAHRRGLFGDRFRLGLPTLVHSIHVPDLLFDLPRRLVVNPDVRSSSMCTPALHQDHFEMATISMEDVRRQPRRRTSDRLSATSILAFHVRRRDHKERGSISPSPSPGGFGYRPAVS